MHTIIRDTCSLCTLVLCCLMSRVRRVRSRTAEQQYNVLRYIYRKYDRFIRVHLGSSLYTKGPLLSTVNINILILKIDNIPGIIYGTWYHTFSFFLSLWYIFRFSFSIMYSSPYLFIGCWHVHIARGILCLPYPVRGHDIAFSTPLSGLQRTLATATVCCV